MKVKFPTNHSCNGVNYLPGTVYDLSKEELAPFAENDYMVIEEEKSEEKTEEKAVETSKNKAMKTAKNK